MKKQSSSILGIGMLALACISAVPALADDHDGRHSKWLTGDFHQHTYFTDGNYPMNDLTAPGTIATSPWKDPTGLFRKGVMPSGFRFGLDFQANSEHGGIRARDGFGSNWATYSPQPAVGDPTSGQMWRWQSLVRTSDIPGYAGPVYMGAYDWILGVRANYPEKIVMTGMEWNPPGHEHSSTGIIAADAKPIAEFEYRFDKSDTDGTATATTATTMGWEGKRQNGSYTAPDYSAVLALNAQHGKTIDAVKWMQANYPTSGWIIPAHVERAGCGVNAWSIAAFRDMNDNGPTVAFGFEGIPGHEKSSNRGEFGTGACGGGTYGGAGRYVAEVGGLWDNLLADGRKFFNFASSDYHDDGGADFWPGEYLKTYVMVKGNDRECRHSSGHGHDGNHFRKSDHRDNDCRFSAEDVLNGLRSGNVFSVHGDIINVLDFKAVAKNHDDELTATMGETLFVKKGHKVVIEIRFKSPATNNCKPGVNASAEYVCAQPTIHHVQLIQGRVNPAKAGKFLADGVTPNPAFNAIDPTVASIVKTFDAGSWRTDDDGFTTMTFTIPKVESDMFFRIRGTNLGYDAVKKTADGKIIYGTDAAGSPLLNTPGTNSSDTAWDDLWFYSNPIFVKAL